ncbi:MAG: serine/threonine dehydratase [Rickettsiaceae bacterium]|nr:serine/threonine dehydratase [Rickettsiaceae bacterium]
MITCPRNFKTRKFNHLINLSAKIKFSILQNNLDNNYNTINKYTINSVSEAEALIRDYIVKTPIIVNDYLNKLLGHNIYFKDESSQKTGAFKIRGVLASLLEKQKQNNLPDKMVAYSTGNHGIAIAYAAKLFNIQARVYLPTNVAEIKRSIIASYGGEVIATKTRKEAEEFALQDGNNGFSYMHPSKTMSTFYGVGTLCLEALKEIRTNIDAIFGSCGGGGLLSGTFLAKEEYDNNIIVIGAEPEVANDAYLSIKQGKIYELSDSPNTVADGLRTLKITEQTFQFLKKLDDFITISENDILYWTAWLNHLLPSSVEPSCAISMAAACRWLAKQKTQKNILVIISGGNIYDSFIEEILSREYLHHKPNLKNQT